MEILIRYAVAHLDVGPDDMKFALTAYCNGFHPTASDEYKNWSWTVIDLALSGF